MNDPVFDALAQAARAGEAVALGIISGVKGSSPQKVGAKAIFYSDGRITGTLGGGCLEAEVQQRAIQSLRTGQGSTFELVLDHDFGWDDGLICGGKVMGLIIPEAQQSGEEFWTALAARSSKMSWGVSPEFKVQSSRFKVQGPLSAEAQRDASLVGGELLYKEDIAPPCALWIAGAGHIAQAVAPLAWQLDFEVTVFDDRPALVSHRFFPREVHLQSDVWEKLLAVPSPQTPSFGLVVTRGHRHDALVLQNWIHRPFEFLGMIGSARKARMIFDHFVAEKIATREDLQRVACPVGIDIQSRTVPEIAVSILAQFIEKRARTAAGPGD
ncbi:MAG: hypothetical protein C5B50_23190 [Verrucomicrobia bacterium]|nr:MAG: hypothetical protein C5B50_23190 [Verrucomicrobiota bacterium]